jgi:hypothetical protein
MSFKDDPITLAFFKASTQVMVGNGNMIFFWSGPWLDGQSIPDLAPGMVATVASKQRTQRIVVAAISGGTWMRDKTKPLIVLVRTQYLHLRHIPECSTWPDHP